MDAAEKHSLKDDNGLARLDSALLHLEAVDAVLLLELGDLAVSGQLAGLADGDEGGAEAHGNDGAEEEAARIKADNHVRLGRELLRDVRDEVRHEGLERVGVAQDREDVEEGDALRLAYSILGSVAERGSPTPPVVRALGAVALRLGDAELTESAIWKGNAGWRDGGRNSPSWASRGTGQGKT